MVKLRFLSYMAMVSRERQCILPKQHTIISEKVFETQRLLYAWVKSDEESIKKMIK